MAKSKSNLPARVEDMTALQAIASFNEYEQKIFKELSDIIKKHNKETLIWYWDLGVRIVAILEDTKKNKEHYGKDILGRISTGLGFKTAGPLYQAKHVVEALGTKKAFTEFTKLASEAGNVLTWGHIVMLAGIGDSAMRLEIAGQALEQGWTVATLGQQVAKLVDRKQRGIRKAKPKVNIPGSVKKCLQHVTAQAENFRNMIENSWTGDAFDIMAQIEDIPASNLNEALLREFEATTELIGDMIEKAGEMAEGFASAQEVIRRKLAAQAEADAAAELEAAAEEAEDEDDEEEVEVEDDEEVEDEDDEEEVEDDGPTGGLEEIAGDDDEDSVVFVNEELASADDDDDDNYVNVGEQLNARAREKRALARAQERHRAARRR